MYKFKLRQVVLNINEVDEIFSTYEGFHITNGDGSIFVENPGLYDRVINCMITGYEIKILSRNSMIGNQIEKLENEANEMQELISELERAKYEAIG